VREWRQAHPGYGRRQRSRTPEALQEDGSLVFSGVQNYCIIKYISQHIDVPTS
jgi:hypothetical protein